MDTLWERLKSRKLIQWLLVYITACWAVLEVMDTLSDFLPLVDSLRPTAFTIMVMGLPFVAVLAWYHGEKGRQQVSGVELMILATLLGGLGGVFALMSRGSSDSEAVVASGLEVDVESSPAIAVLPAIAAGPGAQDLGEGLVSLVSNGLDGVEGWRGVSPRTVRARWLERVPEGAVPDEITTLDIARASGGQYAVLPTVTVLGSTVRVSADVHNLDSTVLAPVRVEVEGDSDNLLPLADELAVQTLAAVLQGEGEIPAVDLARTASDSPEAVRAFLAGEVFYRDFQLVQARDAFNRALALDSAYALAHYRLTEVHNWGVTWDVALMDYHLNRAFEHIDRLAEREALVVRARMVPDRAERVRLLREAVTRYPDDATAWYMLGERLIHTLGLLASPEEVQEPFYKAIELDPYRAVFYPHAVVFPFRETPDSALASELVTRFADLAAGLEGPPTADGDPRGGPIALELAFGDPATRDTAWARLARGSARDFVLIGAYLGHPRYWDRTRPIMEVNTQLLASFGARDPHSFIARTEAVYRGRVEVERWDLDVVDEVETRWLYRMPMMGVPFPVALLDQAFGVDSIHPGTDSNRLRYAAYHAADQGRWEDFTRAVELLRTKPEWVANDPSAREWVAVLHGYESWKRYGDTETALEQLRDLTGEGRPSNLTVVWHLGDLYLELERWSEAERVFRSAAVSISSRHQAIYSMPPARFKLAQALEAQGKNDEAADAYAYFVEHWADADPGAQAMVEEARAALARLQATPVVAESP